LTGEGGRTGAAIVSGGGGFVVIFQVEGDPVAIVPAVSRTEIVKVYSPTLVGVPLRMPVDSIAIPGGSPPEETKNVYGGIPPEAASATGVIGTLTGEGGRTGGAIVKGSGLTVNERAGVLAVRPSISITPTTKVKEPVSVGVPPKTPVVELSNIPFGSDPDVTDHVKGDVPPVTRNVDGG
jgi:hypothetical protein